VSIESFEEIGANLVQNVLDFDLIDFLNVFASQFHELAKPVVGQLAPVGMRLANGRRVRDIDTSPERGHKI
jgi:hypothetical protein